MSKEIERHPDFDACWKCHEKLVWWLCHKVAKLFGGQAEDYLATYVLRLNKCLHTYDPLKGKFSTYFMRNSYDDAVRLFLRFESEHKAVRWAQEHSTNEALKQAQVEHTYHETNNILYRVPEEDQDELRDIVESFGTVQECWDFFCRPLTKNQRFVVEQMYREGLSGPKIAERLKVSKQRVFQLRDAALVSIRRRLLLVQRFTELFQKRIDET